MPDGNSPDPRSNGPHAPAGDARLQNLLERVCDQLATPAEAEELGERLAADKDAREYYLSYVSLHSSLQNYASPAAAPSSFGDGSGDEGDEVPSRRASLRRPLAMLAAAAAIAGLAAGLLFR